MWERDYNKSNRNILKEFEEQIRSNFSYAQLLCGISLQFKSCALNMKICIDQMCFFDLLLLLQKRHLDE